MCFLYHGVYFVFRMKCFYYHELLGIELLLGNYIIVLYLCVEGSESFVVVSALEKKWNCVERVL